MDIVKGRNYEFVLIRFPVVTMREWPDNDEFATFCDKRIATQTRSALARAPGDHAPHAPPHPRPDHARPHAAPQRTTAPALHAAAGNDAGAGSAGDPGAYGTSRQGYAAEGAGNTGVYAGEYLQEDQSHDVAARGWQRAEKDTGRVQGAVWQGYVRCAA